MQALKTAILTASFVALVGCSSGDKIIEDTFYEEAGLAPQSAVCVEGWYGYWEPPCPPKPAVASRSASSEQLAAELDAAYRDIANLQSRVGYLDRQLAAAKAAQPAVSSTAELETAKLGLVRALKPEIEKGDISVDVNSERLLIKLASSYLFGSGEARLKPEGADALKRVGEVLKDYPEYNVAVEGHTDNRPLRSTLKKQFATNQELSEARAANAAKALVEGGLGGATMAGLADTKPLASNNTDEGRAKNRRVEIRVTR